MTTQLKDKEESKTKETREITFRCKYCGRTKPLSEIITLTRFFPPLVACKDCERKMQ